MKSLNNIVFYVIGVLLVFTLEQVSSGGGRAPVTRFTCQGRPTGYYADVDTGCQLYHMCDGMGRQFTYTCPNTTLFQQRMLVCDHWYMVNCSNSENDYSANLLIGQRDKPFVSEQEMHMRTPRPDILTVPYNNNYYDGLKQAETKFSPHFGNSIVSGQDTSRGESSIREGKTRLPITQNHQGVSNSIDDNYHSSSTVRPSFSQIDNNRQSTNNVKFISSTSRTTEQESDEFDLDIRMKNNENQPTSSTFNFIKRFDPNSPPTRGTAMSTSEILDINRQLPTNTGVLPEEGVSRRKSFNPQNNVNTFQTNDGKQMPQFPTRIANTKAVNEFDNKGVKSTQIPAPYNELLPPKKNYVNQPSTTMGPPIYYEWKWAVPAFDLELPKLQNITTNSTDPINLQASESGRPTFPNRTRSSASSRSLEAPTPSPTSNAVDTEYHPSSYFVPDYIFPLDDPHPGYQQEGAQTSFQVPKENSSYGENPQCPQCHPAYLKPGTCEPCIVKR